MYMLFFFDNSALKSLMMSICWCSVDTGRSVDVAQL